MVAFRKPFAPQTAPNMSASFTLMKPMEKTNEGLRDVSGMGAERDRRRSN